MAIIERMRTITSIRNWVYFQIYVTNKIIIFSCMIIRYKKLYFFLLQIRNMSSNPPTKVVEVPGIDSSPTYYFIRKVLRQVCMILIHSLYSLISSHCQRTSSRA